jgi:hypothetical protein
LGAQSAIGLEVVGPGGGSWTIRRDSEDAVVLERGLLNGEPRFTLSAGDLGPLLRECGALAMEQV